MTDGLEVRDIPTSGKGVFAVRAIKEGERLAMFGGYVMTLEEEMQLPDTIKDYAHQIDDNFVIGVKKIEDIQPTDYLNHSCNPNAGFKGQIALVAMRDIQIGEEVVFDYAMVLAESDHAMPYTMSCVCGSPRCRKNITDSDWRNPVLQERYRGYFQPYIQEKIDRLHQN